MLIPHSLIKTTRNMTMAASLILFSGLPVGAQLSTDNLQPGPTLEPQPQTLCRHSGKFYPEGTVLEINGNRYMCTRNNGWVLLPPF
jgi:hypothetical protein